MALYGGARDISLFQKVNRELMGNIITQQCVYYKLRLNETKVNMYGEAAGGKKVYKNGVQMNALVEADDFDFNTDEFGPDRRQNVVFAFQRDYLVEVDFRPEIGDIVNWNLGYRKVLIHCLQFVQQQTLLLIFGNTLQ